MSRPGMWSASSARTRPGRPPCSTWPPGCWRRPPARSRCLAARPGHPGPARQGGVRRPGRAGLRRAAGRRSPEAGRAPQPGLGRRPGAPPDRAARPGPRPESGETVGRAAGPARADPGHRQAARVADLGRAGRQPGPAGPAGVPAGPDGGNRRAGPVRGAVRPPDRRPGTDLLLPDRAVRPAPGPGHAAGRPAGHLGQPHRPAHHAAGAHQRPGLGPGLDGLRGQLGRSGPGLHEAGQARPPQPPPGGAEMIWLTWRQFRAQAVTAAAALAVFAVLLAVTGPHLASLYAASGISGCYSQSCGQLASNFLSQLRTGIYPAVYLLGIAGIVLAPAVIGIFWGAPLIARELEAGTFRLAWTQSVTRARWLAVKLALTGLAAMASPKRSASSRPGGRHPSATPPASRPTATSRSA